MLNYIIILPALLHVEWLSKVLLSAMKSMEVHRSSFAVSTNASHVARAKCIQKHRYYTLVV